MTTGISYAGIRAAGDCRQAMIDLGFEPSKPAEDWDGPDDWLRFENPFRPSSDSNGFAACKELWCDHARQGLPGEEGGDLGDLVARIKFDDNRRAAEEWLCLARPARSLTEFAGLIQPTAGERNPHLDHPDECPDFSGCCDIP